MHCSLAIIRAHFLLAFRVRENIWQQYSFMPVDLTLTSYINMRFHLFLGFHRSCCSRTEKCRIAFI